MNWCHRIYVVEGIDKIVLINTFGRDFFSHYLAKYTVLHPLPPVLYSYLSANAHIHI